jgi:hypothetical protein
MGNSIARPHDRTTVRRNEETKKPPHESAKLDRPPDRPNNSTKKQKNKKTKKRKNKETTALVREADLAPLPLSLSPLYR